MTEVKIYTDGSARGNPDGPGGYGVVMHYVDKNGQLHEKTLSAGYKKTTNNRMELMAAIAGLEALNRPCKIGLYSDSKYLTDAFNKNWISGWIAKGWNRGKSGPVKNIDLWKRLLKAKEQLILMIYGAVSTQPQFLRKSYKILLLSNLYSQAPDFVVLYDWKTLLFIRDVKE